MPYLIICIRVSNLSITVKGLSYLVYKKNLKVLFIKCAFAGELDILPSLIDKNGLRTFKLKEIKRQFLSMKTVFISSDFIS